jgi:protein-tyrosine phosphatase
MARLANLARAQLRQLVSLRPVLTLHLAMGAAFLCIAAALAGVSSWVGGRAWFLVWPAAALLLVGAGYMGLGSWVTGKRRDGTFRWHAALLVMPYLAAAELAWYAVRVLGQDEPWREVARGLYLGRRVQHWELPARVGVVLDMTAEFVEPPEVRSGRVYLCVPTLDGAPPDAEQLAQALARVLPFQGNVYIHCAAGYGRSAMAMAVLLVGRGIARDLDHAIHLMRRERARVRLRTSQRRRAEQVLARLRELSSHGPRAPQNST